MNARSEVRLRQAAWFGDEPLTIDFPASWDVEVIPQASLPPLSEPALRERLRTPIGTEPLIDLARGRTRAAIVIDDLTRPTPTAELASLVVEELVAGGLGHRAITIVLAGGTHAVASREEIEQKVGADLLGRVRVVAHDMRHDHLVDLGHSRHGVPVLVNRAVVEADLKVGIGGIYPHPAAGFSGGSKILAPGVCGLETARFLHDFMSEGNIRCVADNRFRDATAAVARTIGLDFVINVVLNFEREITAVFAGDMDAAHREGVRFVRRQFQLDGAARKPAPDIVIADTYPFDSTLQFAADRGFWPLAGAVRKTTTVAIAVCPLGLGSHELDLSLGQRLYHRLTTFSLRELSMLPRRVRNLRRLLAHDRVDFILTNIERATLTDTLPKTKVFRSWEDLRTVLEHRHAGNGTRVVVYRCAPLLVTSTP